MPLPHGVPDGIGAAVMRILLTGSSGWLGRFLAPRLRNAGHEVTGLDVAPGADTQVTGTVADRALVDRVFGERGIEAVIHSGALHKPDIVRYPAQAFVDVNVTGTLNLLEAAVAAKHDRFVFTSTTSLMISAEIRSGKMSGGGAAEAVVASPAATFDTKAAAPPQIAVTAALPNGHDPAPSPVAPPSAAVAQTEPEPAKSGA